MAERIRDAKWSLDDAVEVLALEGRYTSSILRG